MSIFWSLWITVLSLACWGFILGALLFVMRTKPTLEDDGTTGHAYDGITEYDKPLPKWWVAIFFGSIVWALVYWVLWPALMPHTFKGLSTVELAGKTVPWTSHNELYSELERNDKVFTDNFKTNFLPNPQAHEQLAKLTSLQLKLQEAKEPPAGLKDDISKQIQGLAPYVTELSKNQKAYMAGERLFLQNCSVCHGSNAKGGVGYPNLTDNDWLYGGEPENILMTLHNGRIGGMAAWRDKLGEDGIRAAAEYVLSISGNQNGYELDKLKVAQGEAIFKQQCVVCHGPDAKGTHAAGAPNLTDKIWLYGGDRETVRETLRHGRAGVMPAWQSRLGNERIMLLAAYVSSFSGNAMKSTSTVAPAPATAPAPAPATEPAASAPTSTVSAPTTAVPDVTAQ